MDDRIGGIDTYAGDVGNEGATSIARHEAVL